MVAEHQILGLFNKWFTIEGKGTAKILDDNSVHVDGSVKAAYLQRQFLQRLPFTFHSVTGNLSVSDLGLRTLQGCPRTVGESFSCHDNHIETLEGGPESIGGDYSCNFNQLTNLKGAPDVIPGYFNCLGNPLQSLDGFPQSIGVGVWITYTKHLPLLKLLCAPSIFLINRQNPPLQEITDIITVRKILDNYAGNPNDRFSCQKDLEEAGFPENARW